MIKLRFVRKEKKRSINNMNTCNISIFRYYVKIIEEKRKKIKMK